MTRKLPGIQPPSLEEITPKEDPTRVRMVREYKLMTPLYGGGVKPNEPDPITVVRASEVRGHLRFWWRATRGGACGSIEEMQTKEAELWGSSEKPSSIQIRIINSSIDHEVPAFVVKPNPRKSGSFITESSGEIAPYAAFPLLPDKDQQKQSGWMSDRVAVGVTFKLEIACFCENEADLKAALWAWEVFGGLGARTRRGFGALQLETAERNGEQEKIPEIMNGEVKKHIVDQLGKHVSGAKTWLPGLPHLSLNSDNYRILEGKTSGDPVSGWKSLLGAFEGFRQARYKGKFGKSKWPEASAIQSLVKRKPGSRSWDGSGYGIDKYPRAQFGLPIIYHLPHAKPSLENLMLRGESHDRLASPLILKPLACRGGAVGLAAVLEWDPVDSEEPYTPPGGLKLQNAPDNPAVKSRLTKEESKSIEPLNGDPDVLRAFLKYLDRR